MASESKSNEPGSPLGGATRAALRGPGFALAGVAGVSAFVLCANAERLPRGPLLGLVLLVVAILGLLEGLGLLVPRDGDRPVRETALFGREGEPAWVAPLVAVPVSFALLLGGALAFGYDHLPATILVALAPLVPAALRRPALLVALVTTALYLPFLGTYALWDPWETHYGEVAREMLSRDDWISLWWAQDHWFWSKPIFIFFVEAFSLASLGVDPSPDAHPLHPEWALRLPHFFLALLAVLAIHLCVSKAFGRRAGVLSALVVATMPHFSLIAHQAITDMPLVACLVLAMCSLGLALVEEGPREAPGVRVGRFAFSGTTAAIALLLLLGLPQILYLASRQITFHPWRGFSFHEDQWLFGSGGNDGTAGPAQVPGNPPHHVESLPFPHWDGDVPFGTALVRLVGTFWEQPLVQALQWSLLLVLLVRLARRDRTVRGQWMTAFYVFCAMGFVAKGIPGFALPGLIAFFYLVASNRWSLLVKGELHVVRGVLVIAVLGLPWYWAMCVRHGMPFLDRILVHDHINRLAAGVHGDNGPIDYFLAQLGYGTFPWVGLLPMAALLFVAQRARRAGAEGADFDPRRELVRMIGMWALASFTLFNAMVTKFHHYILPVVPPLGMMAGLVLDRAFGAEEAIPSMRRRLATLLAVASPALVVLGVAGLGGDPRGVIPAAVTGPTRSEWIVQHPWPTALAGSLLVGGLVLALVAAVMLERTGATEGSQRPDPRFGIAMIVGAVGAAFVGRDLSWVTAVRPQGYERFIGLFVYNYARPWPEQFDYRPILVGFAVVAFGVTLLLAWPRLRPLAARALLGLSFALSVFALDVYLPDLAEHWSSNLLVDRYYAERRGSNEPLLAFQMNWKGENFYTGNRVFVFQDLDTTNLRRWIGENPNRTFFVVLEHSRLANFRSMVPNTTVSERSTPRDNNKFLLIRVAPGAPGG
ncbi:MAG: glycosyltransferase family 39 protein [Polyangiales bacterium]